MSGRVGDLSPKQKEALAKVSRHPGPAPVRGRGLALPRQLAGKGSDGGRATGLDGRAAEGAAAGGTWRLAPLAPAARPTLAAPVEEEARGKFGSTPASAPREPLAVPPGKKWLLRSPRRQPRAQRQYAFSRLAAGPWGQGQG